MEYMAAESREIEMSRKALETLDGSVSGKQRFQPFVFYRRMFKKHQPRRQ